MPKTPAKSARKKANAPARPALFLDRDGVLNRDTGFLYKPEDFFWLDGARETVRLFNDLGYLVFVVTNQSGVAQGFFEEAQVQALHAWINEELAEEGARVDAFYYCPHHPQATREAYRKVCPCRKPAPGMLQQAMAEWPVDAARSLLIGDNQRDLEAGKAAGVPGYLFRGGNLLEMARAIVETGSASERGA